jgi:hypothetical protein
MIISTWLILATILCVWFIITDRNYFNLPWIILIICLIYAFLPVILFAAVIYFVLYALGFITRR